MKHLMLVLSLALFSNISYAAQPLKIFHQDSLDEIKNELKDQPFILLLWSIDCPPCLKELGNIQNLVNQLAPLEIVFISIDGLDHSNEINKTLKEFQLEDGNHWVFSNAMPERLRSAIDPNWYGELPRSYFYNEYHESIAHSGILSAKNLQQWVKKYGFLKRVSRFNDIRHLDDNEFY